MSAKPDFQDVAHELAALGRMTADRLIIVRLIQLQLQVAFDKGCVYAMEETRAVMMEGANA